jgi:hypothetical protein
LPNRGATGERSRIHSEDPDFKRPRDAPERVVLAAAALARCGKLPSRERHELHVDHRAVEPLEFIETWDPSHKLAERGHDRRLPLLPKNVDPPGAARSHPTDA